MYKKSTPLRPSKYWKILTSTPLRQLITGEIFIVSFIFSSTSNAPLRSSVEVGGRAMRLLPGNVPLHRKFKEHSGRNK